MQKVLWPESADPILIFFGLPRHRHIASHLVGLIVNLLEENQSRIAFNCWREQTLSSSTWLNYCCIISKHCYFCFLRYIGYLVEPPFNRQLLSSRSFMPTHCFLSFRKLLKSFLSFIWKHSFQVFSNKFHGLMCQTLFWDQWNRLVESFCHHIADVKTQLTLD